MAHISLTDLAILAGVVVYVILQVKDYRPIRALRQENSELRKENDELRQRLDALERKYDTLEKSRDFDAAFKRSLMAIENAEKQATREHERLLETIKQHSDAEKEAWAELSRGLAANTTALAALAAGIHAN